MGRNITILGIDPGYDRLGFSIINGYDINNFRILSTGLITTDPKLEYRYRLKTVYNDMRDLFSEYKIDVVSIEKLFFWRNITTAFKVGMAMGVLYLLMDHQQYIEVHPVQLKKFITGHGRASKRDVMHALKIRFSIQIKAPDDVWDALGIALYGLDITSKKNKNNKDLITK